MSSHHLRKKSQDKNIKQPNDTARTNISEITCQLEIINNHARLRHVALHPKAQHAAKGVWTEKLLRKCVGFVGFQAEVRYPRDERMLHQPSKTGGSDLVK